jgi:hypothetical protein
MFIFKLRIIAFIFKTSVEEFGGRSGMQRIALPPAPNKAAFEQGYR